MKYVPIIASLPIVAAFLIVLFSHVWIYPLFNVVLLGVLLLFLKRYEWKTVATILSPVLVIPFVLYCIDVFGRILPMHSSDVWSYGFITVVALICTYLFKDLFTRWIEPKNHKTVLCLILVLFASSVVASIVATHCLDISSAEKGVSLADVRTCQTVGAYLPSAPGKFFGWPRALQVVSFVPSALVLLLALVQRFVKQRKST